MIQVITFARALTDTGKHRNAAMALGDVVDQFLNGHGLAHTGTAEKADLAALQVRGQQVNHLNASNQDFRAGRLFVKGRRFAVNRVMHGGGHRAALINRLTDHVQDSAQRAGAHRHGNASTRVNHFGATHQTVRGVHRDAAHGALTQMLRHFQDKRLDADLQRQRVHDRGQLGGELNVHHGTKHLRHLTNIILHGSDSFLKRFSARDDFNQLSGDVGLTCPVVIQRKLIDHVARIARGVIHGSHLATIEAGGIIQ